MKRYGGRSIWDAGYNPLAYFTIALVVGASVNVISGCIAQLFPVAAPRVSVGIIVIALVALLFPAIRESLMPRRSLQPISSLKRDATKYRGLIAFVSVGGGSKSAERAIQFHTGTLVRAWLLHSPSSEADAARLKKNYGGVQLVPLTEAEFEDPEAVKNTIDRIYSTLHKDGLHTEDVVIDITGGTKRTTAGGFLAGLPEDRNLEVISAEEKDASGHAVTAGDPIEIDISYRVKPLGRR